jgi:periplasmic protein TonB
MLRFTLALFFSFTAVAYAQDSPKPDSQVAKLVRGPAPELERCSKPVVGEKMSVIVHLDVTTEGLPDAIAVDHTSGDECVDESAVTTVQQYRFRPATRDGKPVVSHIRIRVDFERRQKE